MDDRRKEDDMRWLQVIKEKEERRARRRRQVLIRKILLSVFVIAVVASAVWFAVGVSQKKEKQGQQSSAKTQQDEKSKEHSNETGDDEKQGSDESPDENPNEGLNESPNESSNQNPNEDAEQENQTQTEPSQAIRTNGIYQYQEKTRTLGKGILSNYAVLVDPDSHTILAAKGETQRIVPASMTKVLTLLTAVEHLKESDFDKKFRITAEITDFCYLNECSVAGFEIDEKVTVTDLLYGTILPSGADASMALAEYVAGSQEAFVEMMNDKLEELGLSDTAHVTNCIGIFDEEHYCTVLDMAAIMEAAFDQELCRQVLSARTYTTSKSKKHPEGILLSNWFLRRIEDKDTGGEVVGAKTGYVAQAGNCSVSYGVDTKARNYICVTADAPGSWKCIYDHVKIYKRFSGRK